MSPEERKKAIEDAYNLVYRVAAELRVEDQDEFAINQCDRAARALEKVLKQWEREGEDGSGT